MIGLNNADSSFFTISSPDVELSNVILSEDVVSLSITEEVGQVTSGTITLRDENLTYPKNLRMGVKLDLAWGYKDVDDNIRTILALDKNKTEVFGTLLREGMTGYIKSPSGGGDQNGYSYYNCSFYGSEYSRRGTRQIYRTGTKATVVAEVFSKIGVGLFEINFTRGNERIGRDTQVLQWESDFRFLQRIAREWRATFRVGYTSSGVMYGMFVDYDKFDLSQFQSKTTGTSFGNSILLDWKKGTQNVISYKWRNHQGESGSGDNIQLTTFNGKPTFIRYIATTERTIAYRFVPEKITKDLKKAKRLGGVKSMNDYISWALNVQDFQRLVDEGYFVPYVQETAPQGLGYSADVQCLGNPMITPPMRAKFGEGFPDVLASSQIKMFIRRAEHSISRDGYKLALNIVDTLTHTGGSFI